MKRKRILFLVLFFLFVTLAAWWIFYFPYDPERLYRAIPTNAIFISEHEKLAERWETFARNPLTLILFSSLGIEKEEFDEIVDDPLVAAMVARLAARNTVIAYVPLLYSTHEPAWIVASWVGGYGQLLRWGSWAGLIPGRYLKKINLHGGRQAWLLNADEQDSDSKWSFAVVEGVLLACFSPDAAGVRHIMNRIERGASLLPELQERLAAEPEVRGQGSEVRDEGHIFDRGWANWYRSRTDTPMKLSYALTSLEGNSVAGRMSGNWGLGIATSALQVSDSGLTKLGRILGDAPDAFVIAPFTYVEPFLSGRNAPDGMKAAGQILRAGTPEGGFAFVCLLGRGYSGRILGLKVPTVMFGIEIEDGDKALDMVAEALDKLNAQYGWALIPRRVETSGRPAIVLDSSRAGIYSSLSSRQRAVFAVEEGWLVFSSNMEALNKLLVRSQRSAAVAQGLWRAKEVQDASAYAWLDLESMGQSLRNAIAVYSLILMVQNDKSSVETRRSLEYIKGLIDSAQPLKTCFFWLGFEGSEFEVRFKLGADFAKASAPKQGG